ncbi:oocyte zinc finger protein XlCOF19-like [Rhipicephalus sanguineus]|uniref:oocyte zinc finger protein XlCOF19-like n=1 Tax=Rhipicephalus sanguineus TaxID=34632 RepID=UPI0020C35DAA|nr:oocyte zinc finger protein XlCOF19-like [Rhipicephalus sanguineus]
MADEEKEGRRRDNIWRSYLEDSSNEVPAINPASTAQGTNSTDVQLPPPHTHEAARPLLTTTAGSSHTPVPGTSSAPIQQQNASNPEGMWEGSNQEHGSDADEEPRNACTFSEEAYKCAEDLAKLTRVNLKKRKHLCHECRKRFRHPSDLQRHYRTHSGEKPYTCDVCQRKFALEGNLKQHQVTHTKEQPFCCDYCGTRFKRKTAMTKHINKLHPGNRESESGGAK